MMQASATSTAATAGLWASYWADAPGLAAVLSPLERAAVATGAMLLAIAVLGLATEETPAPSLAPARVAEAPSAPTPTPIAPVRPSAPSAPVLEPGARAPTPLLPTPPSADERQVWTAPPPGSEPAPPPPPPPPPQALPTPKPDNSLAGAFRNFERDLARLFGQGDEPRGQGRGKKKGHKDGWR